jgi:gliding motility-associated lipoprotein GldD
MMCKKCLLLYGYSVFFLFVFFILSCETKEQNYVPKPKGFNRIELPPHSYANLEQEHPYRFAFSKWAVVLPDTFATAGKDWIFVHYPKFGANIQLTYKPVDGDQNKLREYINDAYKLAGKHQIRASSIQESRLVTQNGYTAMLFKIEGDVPSPYQFYTTDSTSHFMRGAIYFPVATKNDSLAPVIDYLQKDMIHLLNTLKWR